MRTGRPRAITKAYRIIARPYVGWLYKEELYTDAEWYAEENRRRRHRRYRARRAGIPEQDRP